MDPYGRTVVVAAVALALGACSLAVSTSGLTGGAPDAPTGDGGSAAEASIVAEGGMGGPDARVDAAEASVPFCASRPGALFCDDFDGSPPATVWEYGLADATTPTLDALAFSAPRSLRSRLAEAGDCRYSHVGKPLVIPGRRVVMRFAVRLGDQAGAFPNGQFYANLRLEHPTDTCQLLFLHDPSPALSRIMVQGFMGTPAAFEEFHAFGRALDTGTWHVVELTADGTGPDVTMRVDMDGTSVLPTTTLTRCAWDGKTVVEVGLHCASKPGELRIDDVEVRVP